MNRCNALQGTLAQPVQDVAADSKDTDLASQSSAGTLQGVEDTGEQPCQLELGTAV